jgi:hypothetical protein
MAEEIYEFLELRLGSEGELGRGRSRDEGAAPADPQRKGDQR